MLEAVGGESGKTLVCAYNDWHTIDKGLVRWLLRVFKVKIATPK